MKVTYRQLNDSLSYMMQINQYTGPLARIMGNKDLPATTKARMKRIWRHALALFKDFAEAQTELQKQYCLIDEAGELVLDSDQRTSFKSDADEKLFEAEFDALLESEHPILGERLVFLRDFRFRQENEQPYDDFLSTWDLLMLDWLIDDGLPDDPEPIAEEESETNQPVDPVQEE